MMSKYSFKTRNRGSENLLVFYDVHYNTDYRIFNKKYIFWKKMFGVFYNSNSAITALLNFPAGVFLGQLDGISHAGRWQHWFWGGGGGRVEGWLTRYGIIPRGWDCRSFHCQTRDSISRFRLIAEQHLKCTHEHQRVILYLTWTFFSF